jgi:hypothetical protein
MIMISTYLNHHDHLRSPFVAEKDGSGLAKCTTFSAEANTVIAPPFAKPNHPEIISFTCLSSG